MATRFYFAASGSAPVSPAFNTAWNNTDDATRLPLIADTPSNTALATTAYFDNSNQDQDHLIHQWVSKALDAVEIASQTIKVQMRCQEGAAGDNQFLAVSIRVCSNDGTVIRSTQIITLVRDDTEISDSALENRSWSGSSTAITPTLGDRLVVELGTGGDPAGGGDHDTDLRIGDPTAGSDLPENDTATSDDKPWLEFANTITFQTSTPVDGVDGVDLGDTGTADLIVKPSQTDGVNIGDTGTEALIVKPSQSEGIDLGDSATVGITALVSQTDGFDLSDQASYLNRSFSIPVEKMLLGDSATMEFGATAVAGSDGIDIGDSATMIATFVPAGADGVDLGDSATAVITIPAAGTDGFDIGDTGAEALILHVEEGRPEGGWTKSSGQDAIVTLVSDTLPTGITQEPIFELEDDDTGSPSGGLVAAMELFTVPQDGAIWRFSGFVKKTSARDYGIDIRFLLLLGDSNKFGGVKVNTDTGAFIGAINSNMIRRGIIDHDANWWYIFADLSQAGTSDNIGLEIFPGYIDESGTPDPTRVGTQRVCGWRTYRIDTANFGDSATMIATFVLAGADGIDIGDSATMIATFVPAGADGVDIGDTGTADLIVKPSVADGIDLGDTGTEALIVKPSVTDGFDLGDSAVAVIPTIPVDGVDGIDIGDTGTMIATFVPAGTDGIELSDSAVEGIVTPGVGTDGIDLSDSAVAVIRVSAIGTDGIDLSDSSTCIKTFVLAVADGFDIGDTGTMIATFLVDGVEGIDLGDSATEGLVVKPSVADGIEFTDTPDEVLAADTESVTDGIDLGDSATVNFVAPEAGTDGVDLGDTFAGALRRDAIPIERVLFGDSATITIGTGLFEVDGVEGVDLGDTGTMIATFLVAGTDGIDLGDSATVEIVKAVVGVEGVDLGDSATAIVRIGAIGTDGIDLGDSVVTAITIPVVVSSGIEFTDIPDEVLAADTESVTDGVVIGDSAVTKLVVDVMAVVDGVELSDSATIAFMFGVAPVDGVILGDSVAIRIAIPVSATDGIVIGDSAIAPSRTVSLIIDARIVSMNSCVNERTVAIKCVDERIVSMGNDIDDRTVSMNNVDTRTVSMDTDDTR